jgi:hypothetical protein
LNVPSQFRDPRIVLGALPNHSIELSSVAEIAVDEDGTFPVLPGHVRLARRAHIKTLEAPASSAVEARKNAMSSGVVFFDRIFDMRVDRAGA